jgi:hypothetical protein
MSWEKRARGGLYYTQTRQRNGRPVRIYIGGGELGELVAAADEAIRKQRAQVRARRQAEEQQRRQLAATTAPLDTLCRQLVKATLEAAGFYQHHGQWRRHRDATREKPKAP